MRRSTSLCFDDELMRRVDTLRGDVPRSRFVERLLRKALEAEAG